MAVTLEHLYEAYSSAGHQVHRLPTITNSIRNTEMSEHSFGPIDWSVKLTLPWQKRSAFGGLFSQIQLQTHFHTVAKTFAKQTHPRSAKTPYQRALFWPLASSGRAPKGIEFCSWQWQAALTEIKHEKCSSLPGGGESCFSPKTYTEIKFAACYIFELKRKNWDASILGIDP